MPAGCQLHGIVDLQKVKFTRIDPGHNAVCLSIPGGVDHLLHYAISAAFMRHYPSFFLVNATPATRGPALAATAAPIW